MRTLLFQHSIYPVFRSPWRKAFQIFLQRKQSIVLWTYRLTQWTTLFSKRFFKRRLKKDCLAFMVYRRDVRYLSIYHRVVISRLIKRQNLFKNLGSYGKINTTIYPHVLRSSSATATKGFTPLEGHYKTTENLLGKLTVNFTLYRNLINFQKYSGFLQEGLKLIQHKHLPQTCRQEDNSTKKVQRPRLYKWIEKALLVNRSFIPRHLYLRHEGKDMERTSNSRRFSTNKGVIQFGQQQNHSAFLQEGLKPLQHKHLPIVIRRRVINSSQINTLYTVLPRMEIAAKRIEDHFDSTPTQTREDANPDLQKTKRMNLHGMEQMFNPISQNTKLENRELPINYQKIADHVYDLLTRRIMRERERMEELA